MIKQLDFLAVGDITTDAFIRLKDAHVHCNLDTDNCELCVRFGDKIPYEFVEVVRAVGNSPNAAVSAARLGLSSGLVSNIGDDLNGKECLESLKKSGVDTIYIKTHAGIKTNYHYVLWYGADRTILVKHESYPYAFPKISEAPKWLYVSSLGPDTERYHEEIIAYLKQNLDIKLAFQPGTFQISLGAEKLNGLYARAEVCACNKEEAERILNLKNGGGDIKTLLSGMADLGPRITLITDGPNGAYLFENGAMWFMQSYPDPKPPLSRTGAGDAYAGTFVSALILGKTAEEAVRWAPINSMSVVQEIGAQKGLLTRAEIEKYLAEAPEDYVSKKI